MPVTTEYYGPAELLLEWAAMMEDGVSHYLQRLASRTPAPGGGSAAAVCAATGAALLGMVAEFTTGSRRWSDRQPAMKLLAGKAEVFRVEAIAIADQDELAFEAVARAFSLPKSMAEPSRTEMIGRALLGAVAPPVQLIVLCGELLAIAQTLHRDGNPNLVTDVAAAYSMISTACLVSVANVKVNLGPLERQGLQGDLPQVIANGIGVAETARSSSEAILAGLAT